MATAIDADPGRAGPHPDLRAELAVRLDENARQIPELAVPDPAQAVDLQVLQQRTLFGVPWLVPVLRGAPSLVSVDVTVGLVVWVLPSGRRQLVQFQAYRQLRADEDRTTPGDWSISRTGQEWLDNAPERAWSGCFDVSQGLGICAGLLVHTPASGIGGLRLTLADGQVFESLLVEGDDSTLLFAPFHGAELWAGRAQLALLDRQWQPVSVSDYELSPALEPPAA